MSISSSWGILMSALPVTNRERVLFALAAHLQQQFRGVRLLIPHPRPDQQAAMARLDLSWLDLAASWKRFIPGNAPRLICCIHILRHLMNQELNGLLTVSIPTALAALRARQGAQRHPALIVRQSNVVHLRHDARFAGVRPRLRDPLIRRCYPEADHFIAVSNGVADNLMAMDIPASRITVIPNGVDIATVQHNGKVYTSPFEGRYIVAVGRLVPKKDYPTLLRAMTLLPATVVPRLVILGEGPERQKLTALCRNLDLQDRVLMPGFVANPYPIIAAASCLVSSSISEGMPNALLEALALGKPVVATDCPSGPAEILDHGRFGTLVPIGEPQPLAAAIKDMLANPSDPSMLEARAAQFGMDAAILAYEHVIQRFS